MNERRRWILKRDKFSCRDNLKSESEKWSDMEQRNRSTTIIIYIKNKNILNIIGGYLQRKYHCIYIESVEKGREYLKEHPNQTDVVILDEESAKENDYQILRCLKKYQRTLTTSALVCISGHPTKKDMMLLKEGIVDFLDPPYFEEMIDHRIAAAVHMKESKTYYEIESMLKRLPSNIYLKDANGRYIFATHYWHHLDHGANPDWSIRGKTDV